MLFLHYSRYGSVLQYREAPICAFYSGDAMRERGPVPSRSSSMLSEDGTGLCIKAPKGILPVYGPLSASLFGDSDGPGAGQSLSRTDAARKNRAISSDSFFGVVPAQRGMIK